MWQVSALSANLNYSLTYPLLWKRHESGRNRGLKVYLPAHTCRALCLCNSFPFACQLPESYQVFQGSLYRAPGNLLCFFFFFFSEELWCVFPASGLGEWYSDPVASTFSVCCGLTDASIISAGCGSCWTHLFWVYAKEKRTGRSAWTFSFCCQ